MRRLVTIVVILAVGAAAGVGYLRTRFGRNGTRYVLAKLERGPLTATVAATGTLNAVVTVQVGSQISGMVKELHADFNSRVKKGDLIALIDPATYEAQVNQVSAALEQANANVANQEALLEKARADVESAKAALAVAKAQTVKAQVAVVDAKRDLGRKTDLLQKNVLSQGDKDTAQTVYDSNVAQLEAARAQEQAASSALTSAQAQLSVLGAQVRVAQAQVKQSQAQLRQAKVNLNYTSIRAPVDGVVVSRTVDVGQTVAASLQAPTLFTIAQDLTQMQVDTSVDEADVGRVRVGQHVEFTVDSFPGMTFVGRVIQIRMAPQVLQNVVTYDVVVSASNPEMKLLPGMTANVRIVTDQKEDVLKVPNTALRFRPPGPPGETSSLNKPAGAEPTGTPSAGAHPEPASRPHGHSSVSAPGLPGRVWVVGPDGKPKAIRLRIGISDGTWTEVVSGELKEGQEVIVGAVLPTDRPTPQSVPGGPRFRL